MTLSTATGWAFLLLGAVTFSSPLHAASEKPKLVVLIVIDQFRSDYLSRFHSRFLPARKGAEVGGFRALIENGAYYPLAEYDTLQCLTGPGHVTLLSGSLPYANGIPTNTWWDQATQKKFYCTEGSSPKTFLGTNVPDEWKNAGFPSRVVSIALKDRSSIFMGGHRADLALWHDPASFRWMSSKKYRPDGTLPVWVEKANEELAKEKGKEFLWQKGEKITGFSKEMPLPAGKFTPRQIGFPRAYVKGEKKSLASPYGLEITTRLAIGALESEKLGQEKRTDFLLVSLSAHDYLVHALGPNSLEAEEMAVADDREIGKLLTAIERKVGLKNAIVLLSADHGGGHAPEYLEKNGVPGGRIDEEKLDEELNLLLGKKFGAPPSGQKWMGFSEALAFYLNRPALDARSKEARFQAEEIVRDRLLREPGRAFVVTATDILMGRVPPGALGKRVLTGYFPERSGDVILIPRSGWIGTKDYAMHMTAYSYDRYVPLIMTGRGFKKGRYAQSAKIIDLAPTLSYLLGIVPPSLSEGRVLSEALITTQ